MDELTMTQKLELCCEELEKILKEKDPETGKARRSELETEFENSASAILSEHPEAAEEVEKLKKRFGKLNKEYASVLFQLYQTRDLERWEHYALKLKICQELDVLNALPDEKMPEAVKKLKELRAGWDALGAVPHEKSAEIWEEFRKKSNHLSRRINACFVKIDAERSAADECKKALLEETKALCVNPNYAAVTPKIKEIQAKWKAAGVGHIKLDRELFAEFRQLCDRFFADRNAFFAGRKTVLSEASSRKKELIAAATALQANPPENLRRAAQDLYREWREAPYAGREDQKLYEKFKAAIDALFAADHAAESAMADKLVKLTDQASALAAGIAAGTMDAAAARAALGELRGAAAGADSMNGPEIRQKLRRFSAAASGVERALDNLRISGMISGNNARLAAEKLLAELLVAEEVAADFEEKLAVYEKEAGAAAAAEVKKLSGRPADYRKRRMADWSAARRLTLGNMESRLGMNAGLESNLQLLALALENAIKDNFAAGNEPVTADTATEFIREFFASPLMAADGFDDVCASFAAVLEKIAGQISGK